MTVSIFYFLILNDNLILIFRDSNNFLSPEETSEGKGHISEVGGRKTEDGRQKSEEGRLTMDEGRKAKEKRRTKRMGVGPKAPG
jgi:hypothetical protein